MNPSRLASRATHSTPEFQAFPRWPPGSPKFPALWAGQVDFNSSKEPFSWFQHILKALALAWPSPRGALPACFTPHSFCVPAQFLPPRPPGCRSSSPSPLGVLVRLAFLPGAALSQSG